MTDAPTWPAPLPDGPVDARVRVPGSKSLTNRWLVLAALAQGPSTLRHPLRSQDTERMAQALASLGALVGTGEDGAWRVVPPAGPFRATSIDCGQAGTVMRFLPPLAALADGAVRFEGHPSALSRPMGPVLEALRNLGVEVDDEGRGTLPFTVHGRGRRGEEHTATGDVGAGPATGSPLVRIDASASSQFVSALLLAGAALPGGIALEHTGSVLPSLPHVEMTLEVLRAVGVHVDRPARSHWVVAPGPVRAFDVVVEPDLSSAAPFLALAAVTGGRVQVLDWPARTTQPGDRLPQILGAMGARAERDAEGLTVTGPAGGRLTGADLDLGEVGELTPVVAALATVAEGPTRLRGVAHLRGHETDRLAALAAEITRVGGTARETDDGLEIEPGPRRPAVLRTYHDHRMAMFAAVVGAVTPGVQVEDITVTAKTYPGFADDWVAALRGTGAGR